jgi:hypothetical protein
MTQITPHLAVFQGPTGVQLHLTDAYGHVNGVVLLSEDECRALSQVLVSAAQPIVVVDVPAVVVEEEEVAEEPAPEVIEELPVDTDWSAMTKAEIVAEVEERFEAHLDVDARKAVLVAAAVDLETEANDA